MTWDCNSKRREPALWVGFEKSLMFIFFVGISKRYSRVLGARIFWGEIFSWRRGRNLIFSWRLFGSTEESYHRHWRWPSSIFLSQALGSQNRHLVLFSSCWIPSRRSFVDLSGRNCGDMVAVVPGLCATGLVSDGRISLPSVVILQATFPPQRLRN